MTYRHYGNKEFDPSLVKPIKNRTVWGKPTGGFWASSTFTPIMNTGYGKNAELKETVIKMNNVITETFSNLTKAKEIMEKLLNAFASNDFFEEEELSAMEEAEQFIKEEPHEATH